MGGVLFGALELWPSWPRETEVEFLLGGRHAQVVELRVAYSKDDQPLHGVTFSFPEGAPPQVLHHLKLPAGTVFVHCELRVREGGALEVNRTVRTPAEGRVRIALEDGRPAA